jgi:hypothetical protein
MTHQKGHWINNVHKEGGEKELTLLDRWTCANGKKWSRGPNEVLVIGLHMVGKMSMGLDLEVLEKFLKQLENWGRLLLLSLFSFSFSPFFFIFFFDRCEVLWIFYFLLSSYSFFITPRTLICIVPTSSPMLRHLLVCEHKGSGVKVGTRCPDERELESSLWSTFL